MNFACNIPKTFFMLHVVAFVFSFALVLKDLISLGQSFVGSAYSELHGGRGGRGCWGSHVILTYHYCGKKDTFGGVSVKLATSGPIQD